MRRPFSGAQCHARTASTPAVPRTTNGVRNGARARVRKRRAATSVRTSRAGDRFRRPRPGRGPEAKGGSVVPGPAARVVDEALEDLHGGQVLLVGDSRVAFRPQVGLE